MIVPLVLQDLLEFGTQESSDSSATTNDSGDQCSSSSRTTFVEVVPIGGLTLTSTTESMPIMATWENTPLNMELGNI